MRETGKRYGSSAFWACVLLAVISRWAEVELPLNISRLIDKAGQCSEMCRLAVILGADILLIITAESLLQLVRKKFLNQTAHRYRVTVTGAMLKTRNVIPSETEKAEYISCFNNDIPMITEEYYNNILNIVETAATILFSLRALLTLNFWILLVILAQIVLLALNPVFFRKKMQEQKAQVSSSRSRYNFVIRNYMEGIHLIRTYLCETVMQKKTDQASQSVNQAEYRDTKLQMFANLFSMAAGYLCNYFIVIVGVAFIASGRLTVGSLLAILQITDLLANPITTVSYYINAMIAVKPIKEKLERMEKQGTIQTGGAKCKTMDEIRIRNLSFSMNGHRILENLHLDLRKGRKYLLTGENGSGKSTLLKVIFQLFSEYRGEILYNGKDIREYDRASLYSHMTMVFQDSFVFPDTLENNITLYEPYPEQETDRLILLLGLEKFRGKTLKNDELSGGERQRIALARAVIRRPDLLLVDEVTSALDRESQYQIEKFLLSLPCCVVHISHHNLEQFSNRYDEIITLQRV